jgi:hypothetical protein
VPLFTRAARRSRIALLLAAIAAFSSASWGLAAWTGWLGLEAGLSATGTAGRLQGNLGQISKAPTPRAVPAILVLGDSTVVNYEGTLNVPQQLRRVLRPEARAYDVISNGFPGSGYGIYFLLADEIARASPDVVVVNFNLGTFGRGWARRFAPVRVGASGWLSPSRLPDALVTPLADIGLTLDEILFRIALTRTRLRRLWGRSEDYQSRFTKTREHLDGVAGKRLGFTPETSWRGMTQLLNQHAVWLDPSRKEEPQRFSRDALIATYGDALTGLAADHPNLKRARAFLCHLRDAGIETIVYLNPTNVDHMIAVGATDAVTIARTVETVGESVEGCGGLFLDLHRIFSDDAFTDGRGHMRADGTLNAPLEIARRLRAPILEVTANPTAGPSAP